MNKITSIAKLVAAFGAVLGAHAALPEPYGAIFGAIVAAATYLARSPLDAA
jgi:hypothetical protein